MPISHVFFNFRNLVEVVPLHLKSVLATVTCRLGTKTILLACWRENYRRQFERWMPHYNIAGPMELHNAV